MSSLFYELLVYICEAVIIGSLYINLLQPKFKIRYLVLLWPEAVLLGMALTPSFSLIRIAVNAVFEFIVIFISFEDKFTHKLHTFLFIEIISAIGALISYLLIGLFTKRWLPFWQICAGDDCTYTLLYLVVLSILASMVFQLAKKVRSIELPWVLSTQFVIGVGECAAILAFAGFKEETIPIADSTLILVSIVCLVIANLSVGIFSSFLIQRFTFSRGIDFGKELSNMEYKYYEMSLENDKKLQELRHDISNQIQTVYSLLINGDSQKSIEMMNELRERYGHVDQLMYCENSVLNIIMANKKVEAEKQGIEVQVKVKDFPNNLPISDFDLSTVVCNMVDNAIRGCICSNQSHPRMIIEIVKKNKYLVIRVLNSCIVNMNIENTDRIESTKSNSQTHGFGMAIIAGVVKRYKGDFVVSAQNGLFTATAVMSIK